MSRGKEKEGAAPAPSSASASASAPAPVAAPASTAASSAPPPSSPFASSSTSTSAPAAGPSSGPAQPSPVLRSSPFVLPVRQALGPQDLCNAAAEGNIAAVESLLATGIHIAAPNARGFTPLHLAVQQGHGNVVDLLLANGAPVSARGPGNLQPLHLAVAAHDASLTRLLINHGAELESAPTGATPFHLAVASGCEAVLDVLLELGANPRAAISGAAGNGETALHMAVAAWKAQLLPRLLAAGLDPNAAGTNPPGQTPLHIAAWYGYDSAARTLLDAGARVNARYADGKTALHKAAQFDQVSMCELLLERGADLNAGGTSGGTALCIAAAHGKKRATEFLFDRSAHLLTPEDKNRVLISGAGTGRVEIVDLLLDKGLDLNHPNKDGFTALDVAAAYSHENVIVYLMGKGAKPDVFPGHPRHSAQLAGATNRNRIVDILTGKISLASIVQANEASLSTQSTRLDPANLAWTMSLSLTLSSRRRIMANPTPGGFPAQCATCQDLDFRRGMPEDAEVVHWVFQGNLATGAANGCPGCAIITQALKKLAEFHGDKLAAWKTAAEPAQLMSMVHGGPLYVACGKGNLGPAHTMRAEIFSKPENPVSWPVVGWARDVPSGPWSDQRMKVVRGFLDNCIANHQTCTYEESPLPTRVIDVGSDNQSPSLYITNRETGRYVTLSHCWGGSSPITTTLTTLHDRITGIELSTLPKTFRDAIIITRSLGVRYLWIDSLCIIQDSLEDWENEALNMSAIYENGYVMIAAEGSDNCHGGCFPTANAKQTGSFAAAVSGPGGRNSKVYFRLNNLLSDDRGEICHRLHSPHGGFQPTALDKRGWTLQERILAPRTLHFGATEVGWECTGGRVCECQTMQTQTDTDSRFKARLIRSEAAGTSARALTEKRWAWSNIVDEFTHRNLTKSGDLLPALSGLAKRMSTTAVDDYACGLWKDQLSAFLFWKPDYSFIDSQGLENTPKRHDGYYAPTWSWASVISPVKFTGLEDPSPVGSKGSNVWKSPYPIGQGEKDRDGGIGRGLLEVTDVQTTKAGANPFGPIASASLTVRGFVAEARLTCKKQNPPKHLAKNSGVLNGMGISTPCADFEPDVPDAYGETSIGDQLFLIYLMESETAEEGMRKLPNGKLEGLSRIAFGSGLVLKAANRDSGTFSRVGTFNFQGAGNWEAWRELRREKTLVLV